MAHQVTQRISRHLAKFVGPRTLSVFGIFVLCVLLQSCEQEVVPITMGANPWPGYEAFHVAQARGLLAEHKTRIIRYPSASEVIRAFRNKAIKIAGLTLDEALLLKETKPDTCIFLVADYSRGADAILAKPHIKVPSDLRGKRVGVEAGALGAYMLSRALDIAGLKAADVSIVNLDLAQHVRAFTHGEIDAVVTFDPVRSALLEEGAVEIFSSRQIPSEILDVFVMSRTDFAVLGPQVDGLIDAWFSVQNDIVSRPSAVAQEVSAGSNITPEAFLNQLQSLHVPNREENALLLNPAAPALLSAVVKLHQAMLEKNLVQEVKPVGRDIVCKVEQ